MTPGPTRRFAQGLRHLLYPGECFACGVILAPEGADFCPACRADMLGDDHWTCPRCAGSIGPYTVTTDGCPSCRGSRFHFERVYRMGWYDGRLRDAILRAKNPAGEYAAEALARLCTPKLAAWLRCEQPTVVIPIPLHWRRRWWRGFNQAEAPARAIAAEMNVPCRPHWLRRIRATPIQPFQSPAARKRNVAGAFAAHRSAALRGETVVLVDDVLTTGSTCSEAARILLRVGARKVLVAVIARP